MCWRAIRERDKEAKAKLGSTWTNKVASFGAGHLMDDLEKKYAGFDEVLLYLGRGAPTDIVEHGASVER